MPETQKTLRLEDVEVVRAEVTKPGAMHYDHDPSDPAHIGHDTDPTDCCDH
ncbi:hypothetical protein [Plantactinospora soyae]|uniref:Uncharacterized protein n=1 Tax=Plantactinospora soyae TaxID=1544732 RepID=A0A927R2S1_9ACTN|nr:hypothetical protein [Plantactinospora soyae]MBE1491068.1 hypothetical protein [Plantactinospora soyae]